jgi:molecular chaperone DnaK (HSP70)
MHKAGGPIDLRARLTRAAAENLWRPLIERSLATCAQTLGLVGLRPQGLSAIYVSGGTTYIPAVRRALAERFGVTVRSGVPPEYAVCLGAGIHAAQLERLMEPTLAVGR